VCVPEEFEVFDAPVVICNGGALKLLECLLFGRIVSGTFGLVCAFDCFALSFCCFTTRFFVGETVAQFGSFGPSHATVLHRTLECIIRYNGHGSNLKPCNTLIRHSARQIQIVAFAQQALGAQ
jgi:hypothetical protein